MKRVSVLKLLLLITALATQISAQEQYKPAPVFSDVLSDVHLRSNGQFKPSTIYAYFLSGDKGRLKVLHNGNEIAEFTFRIEPYTVPKYSIDGFELVKGKNNPLGLMLSEPGEYELAYYANGVKFYSFPFELTVGKSDPYKPNKLMQLNGAWNNYAFLRKTSSESHGKWEFKIFVRSDDGTYKQTKSYLRVVSDQTKKVVAISRNNFRREGSWRIQTLELKKPGKLNTKIDEYYDNKDLYANKEKFPDGGYTVNFYMDGKLYGAYKFTVKAGEIQHSGRQLRGTTDPLRFIEGGGKEFWLVKSR